VNQPAREKAREEILAMPEVTKRQFDKRSMDDDVKRRSTFFTTRGARTGVRYRSTKKEADKMPPT